MKAKTARRLLRKFRHTFAINKMDGYPNKKLKRFYKSILKTLRADVRATKNIATIRILNECVNR